jgi:hypothetical protein
MRAPRGRTPAQDAPAGFPESGRSIRAWVHHPADLTEREAATAWVHGRPSAHELTAGSAYSLRAQSAAVPARPGRRRWDHSLIGAHAGVAHLAQGLILAP